ncbi:MAG: right-handed parallel beta-helix repeat-containing protein [Clostridia bacterium]|nr:right-handed parallel beta-helix repeat-containing protein [Clostridia bacterium]
MQKYYVTDYGVKTDCADLQTAAFQKVFDMCKAEGGMVVVPKGKYHIAALRMWSNTTLYLESGAEIYGSENCEDYEIFPIPEGMEMRSDMELITQYYGKAWDTYRRAMITAYGEKNVSIIGEANSILDGRNCFDPNGEENYRGPHVVFFSCCENVLFEGYTAQHSGNFLHEANNCRNLTMRRVTCLGGSDGIHLHCSEDSLIEDCLFKTGDDCIAGINVKNLLVRRCILNTSCNLFRMGGLNVNVEDCYAYGDGYYPHRMTVVKGRNDELPREQGRHNTLWMVEYFASQNYVEEPSDIHFKNCVFENIKGAFFYMADMNPLQCGTRWGTLTMENVRFTDLKEASIPYLAEGTSLKIIMKNVTWNYHPSVEETELIRTHDHSFTTIIEE